MREATEKRTTKETDITIKLRLDAEAESKINTGIGFFDHMLEAMSKHGGFTLEITVKGDLQVDAHHTVEDVGLVLGAALKNAMKDIPVERFGTAFVPMDESLGFISLDICGRPYLVFDALFGTEPLGTLPPCLIGEFFRAFSQTAGITLHAGIIYGSDDHHKAEALFKALGRALKQAVKQRDNGQILSTKGSL